MRTTRDRARTHMRGNRAQRSCGEEGSGCLCRLWDTEGSDTDAHRCVEEHAASDEICCETERRKAHIDGHEPRSGRGYGVEMECCQKTFLGIQGNQRMLGRRLVEGYSCLLARGPWRLPWQSSVHMTIYFNQYKNKISLTQ